MTMESFYKMVHLSLICYVIFFASVCFSQRGDTNSSEDCCDQLSQLTTRLDEAITDINKLKKLSLTTMSMVLGSTDEQQETCMQETTCDLDNACRLLGTANSPALSCDQLKGACQVPSGVYYVRGGSEKFYKVYCDMEAFGGGWTRFGKGNMTSLWTYENEDAATTTIDLIPDSDVIKMRNMHFAEFKILTDVHFWLQADNSINPSSLSVTWLPSLTPGEMKIVGYADHTHLVFNTQGDRIQCSVGTGGSHRCGHGGTPSVGSTSSQLFIRSAFFGPRAHGASARANLWLRNRYTWNGSFYYILAK